MSLLDLYIDKSGDEKWSDRFKGDSYLFDFTTNFRDLTAFEEGFRTFKKFNDMTKEQYSEYFRQNPDKVRSFIDNIMSTKLFLNCGGKRSLSAKGEVYEKFLLERMGVDDRWFINYIFVADSYFSLKVNYIFERTNAVVDCWIKAGYSLGQIYNAIIYLFNIRGQNMEEYLRSEYIIMLTFMNDTDFLDAYRTSNEFERNELHDYIADNYEKHNYKCIVSRKFAPDELIDCNTVLDDAKILFFSHYIRNSHPISLEDMLDIFMQVYTRFYKLNNKRVLNFLMMYEDVFRMTYLNLFSDMQDLFDNLKIDDKIISETHENFDEEKIEDLLRENLDYTTTESINKLVKINTMLSAAAKTTAKYKCELHSEYKCKYFTNKTSKMPYLEIHQFIPREYANEFSSNIERLSNYIALCPHCHRLLHEAADEERFEALRLIYNKRKERLAADGILPDSKLLFAVYGISQDKLKSSVDFDTPLLDEPQRKLAAGRVKTAKPKTTKSALAKRIAAKKSLKK